jgi:hypothetical protein
VRIVLVKHAMPVLDAAVPPRLWRLGPDGVVSVSDYRLEAVCQAF